MDTAQRKAVREGLLTQGFHRAHAGPDHDSTGEYEETFQHHDGTVVTIDWAAKTPDAAPVQDSPGMYDEPDEGLTFPLPVSHDEARIPNGDLPQER